MKAKMKLHKLLSLLLALVMVVGLLPTGLFVIEAQAADTVTYDSTPANFTYERGTSNTEELTDDYLMVRGYKGAATAAQIPDSVSVDDAGFSASVLQEYKDAGVTTLDVVGVRSHFSSRTELTHIRLGVNIEYLYSSAFTALADTLVDVDIPENSKLTTIWSDAFAGSMAGGTALERIGITTADGTKTYKLPASVSSIHNYAFYHTSNLKSIDLSLTSVVDLPDSTFSHSGISSIVLPANLKYTGWSVFNGCRNLTTLTLPETMEYIGPYCFQDCISLNKLVLRCGVANIGENLGGAFYSMWGINPDCTVYVPQPANQTDYNKVLSLFYSHMGASASVKLRWLDSSYNEMSILPQTAPAVSSSSVVTLSGTYNGAAYSGFTYDYQDTDKDGLGAVIVLDGKFTNNLTLKLNGAYAGNTTQVVWHTVDAYNMRRGNDEYGFDLLRGRKLTDAMVRTQPLGYSETASTTASTSLRLSNSSSAGIYYYIPALINRNDSYNTGSNAKARAQSAVYLPPVMVVYRPEIGDIVRTSISGTTTSSLSLDDETATCGLSGGLRVQVPGFDAWMYDTGDFVNGVTEAKSADGTASITYQWYETDTKTNTGGTAIAAKYGCSGTAVYDGYDRPKGSGIYWRCGGLTESYLAHLRETQSTRTEYFYLKVTITAKGKSTSIVSDPCTLNIYKTPTITGFTVDESDAPAGNIISGVTNESVEVKGTVNMKNGAKNVMFAPKIDGAPAEGDFEGSIVLTWTCNGETYTGSCFLSDWLPTTANKYLVFCKAELKTPDGSVVSVSDSVGFYVKVTSDTASIFKEQPWFDTTEQSEPQYIGLMSAVQYTDLTVHLTDNMFGALNGSTYAPGTYPTVFEVYQVNSADQNRGGKLLFTSDGATGNNKAAEYEIYNANDKTRTVFRGTFKLLFRNQLEEDHSFSGYGAEYYYIKAINKDKNGTVTGVAYSPTFPVMPTKECVPDGTTEPQRSWKVTYKPNKTTWVKKDGSTDASINVGLELNNIPLAQYINRNNDKGDDAKVLYWQYYDGTEWCDLYLDEATDASCPYITHSYSASGQDYTVNGRVILYFDGSVFADNSSWSYLWEGNSDGKIKLRLIVDPDSVYTCAEDDKKGYTSPTEVASFEIIRVDSALPRIDSAHMSGGRENLVWTYSKGAYDLEAVANGDYSVIPDNEYWLFSDRYDGITDGRYGNKPGSENPVVLNGFRYLSSGAHAVVWQLELADGTKQLITVGDEITYDSGEGSADGAWPAYEDKARVAYGVDRSVFALTIDPPTGNKAFIMKATPIAVSLKDTTASATDPDNWAAAKTGTIYTIRVNPVWEATAASVYGSGSYYFNLKQSELPYTITANVSSPDDSVVTCQWYRRSKNDSTLVGGTPVGQPIIIDGRETVKLELTEEVLRAFTTEDGSGTAYFFIYVESYNAEAIKTKTAVETSGFYAVSVNDNYLVADKPVITAEYGDTTPVFVLYGNNAPEAMNSVTVKQLTSAGSQTIYLDYILRDPNTGKVLAKHSIYEGGVTVKADGTVIPSTNGTTLTLNNDGTLTCTRPQVPYVDSYVYVDGVVHYDYDIEFCWRVRNQLSGDISMYATGGNVNSARSKTYTVQQRRAEQPTLQNADMTAANTVTLDAVAQTEGISPADAPDGMGATSIVPAFSQYAANNTIRPVSYVPSLSENEGKSGDVLLAGMEYYDTALGEDGNPKGWTTVSSGFIKAFDSDGNELSADYSGNSCVQTSGEVNYLGFDDFKKSDDTYYYCPEDAQIFLRLVVTAKNGKSTNSVSDPTYSRPFALVRATGTMVNAETPVFTGSDDAFRAFTWNKDDMTVQSHSFGADKWVIGKNGDGEGTLSYQWQRLSMASGGNYVDITGNDTAETPVLTVTRAEIAAWAEDAYTDSNGRPRIFLRLAVTNTNNDASITGMRKVTVTELTYCSYGAAPATPLADASAGGKTDITATAGDEAINASVSVTGRGGLALGELSYLWQYRVVSATPVGGAPFENPEGQWYNAVGTNTESTYTIPTYDSDVYLDVPYDIGGGNLAMENLQISGSSLWKRYDSVTVEYRCEVTNTDGSESSGGKSNTVTVTMSIPTFDLSVTGKYADGTVSDPLRVTTGRSVILSVTEQTGCTYQWKRTNSGTGNGSSYTLPSGVTSDGASLTVTADDYDTYAPYYYCEITDTATGITRKTTPLFVGIENADGSAVAPTVRYGSSYYLDCDVNGAAAESFSVEAESLDGGTLSYQWQEKNDNGNWVDIPGETSDTLALAGRDTAPCKRTFSCVVTNTRGESSISASSGTFTLTVRGVVLENVTITPVAGLTFETTLTATVYGLSGKTVAWTIDGSDFGYTITAVEETVPSGSSASVTAKLSSDTPQTATLNITATVDGKYNDTASVKLRLVDFTIDTEKITCKLDEAMAPFAIEATGARPETGWSWSGDIPAGLSISDSGTVSGTPTVPGAYQVKLKAGAAEKACTVIVQSPAAEKITASSSDRLKIGGSTGGLKSDRSGTGWSWSAEAGVLTLEDTYTGEEIYFSSYNSTPLYIRMKGGVTVNSSVHCYNGGVGMYLYGSGSLTVNSPDDVSSGIHLNGATLYDRRTDGDLTVINSYTGTSNSFGVNGSIDGAGSAGSVTIQNTASQGSSYGVYNNVTCTGSGKVIITASVSESGRSAVAVGGDLTQNGSGEVTVTVDSSANLRTYSSYGVNGTLTQNGSGKVTVTANQNAGAAQGLYGARTVVLNSQGQVNVTADGHGYAQYVDGAYDLTTAGSVNGEFTAKNGTSLTNGANNITLGHTAGSVKLNASGSAGTVEAVRFAPEDTTGYIVLGEPKTGSVTYTAAENKTPVFTVNGIDFVPDASGNASYLLNLQRGEAMEKLTVEAYCNGGCTLTYDDTGKPNGLNVAKTSNVITISGTPGANENKTGSFTITATSADGTNTATLTVNWTMSALKLLVGPSYDCFDLNGNWQVRVGQEEDIYFFAVGEHPDKLQLFDGETMLSDSLSYINCRQIYSVDSAATWYTNAYCYKYTSFNASGMSVGDTKTLTVKALDSSGNVLRDMTVNVTAVNAACPDFFGFSGDYGYHNLGLYDYSGTGWTWNKNILRLTLDGYSSSSSITCDGGPLNLHVQSDSSLGIINAIKGLKITGNSGSTLTVNNTQTNSVPLYMYSGHDLIVDTDGSVIIKSAGKVLYGTSTVKLGTNVQMLRMEGTFTDELTPTFDELTGSYYLYNGTTGATAESPVEGVFLYGTGSNIPDFTVTVTGDASASVGGTAALTAGIPEEITGARKFNSKGEDVGAAFAVTYLWERYNESTAAWETVAGETTATLTPDTTTAGTTQYRCTVTLNGAKSQTGDPVSFTVSPTGVTISGTATSFGSATDNVTVQLIASGESTAAYEAIVKGDATGYSIAGVLPGTYTMKVMKQNHVTREYTVTVGSSNVVQDVKIHLKGDINGDGRVNTSDVGKANSHAKGTSTLTGYDFACADVNGDGRVNTSDVGKINSHAKGTNKLW